MRVKVIVIISIALISLAASLDKVIPLVYPDYFPKPHYNFINNPLTQPKTELGRALFYDPILSDDGMVSCASCHSPYNGFAHTDHALSHGIHDSIGTRNAPALFNLAWNKSFMWDGAINHLDMQALAPISHPAEMGSDISDVLTKIQTKPLYPQLFYKAFGDSLVTTERVLKSLSQFQLTLVSSNSKYDSVQRKESKFSVQEQKGYQLFKTHCSTCHTEPLFTNQNLANNGLPVDTSLNDFGRWNLTKITSDSLLFKIPSLRNLSYTYPYMHDGRFAKLKDVVKHYNTLPSISNTSLTKPIKLSSAEQVDLIAFLLTLNDVTFVFDKSHQYPKALLK